MRRAGKRKSLQVAKNEGARSEEVVMQVSARAAIRGLSGRMEPPRSNTARARIRRLVAAMVGRGAAVADGHGMIGCSFRGLQTVFCSRRRGSGLV